MALRYWRRARQLSQEQKLSREEGLRGELLGAADRRLDPGDRSPAARVSASEVPASGVLGALLFAALVVAPILALPGAARAEEKEASKPEKAAVAAWRVGVNKGLQVQGLSGLRIHPKKSRLLWAHVHGLGPARSEDGGKTWRPMLKGISEKDRPGPRSQVRISLDPRDSSILYCVIDGQIYRSSDGGESWSNITSGALASLSWTKLKSTHLSWEVQVDAKKSVRLLVGTRNDGDHNGGLFESTNGGKSWKEIAGTALAKSGLGNDTYFVRMDPKTDKVVTVAGRRGVFYSDDRGRKFKRVDPGGVDIHDIRGVSQMSGKSLFLADARGVWRSKSAGKKWDSKPLRSGDAIGVFVDPHNKKRLWAIWADRGIEVSEDSSHAKWAPFGGAFGATKEAPGDPDSGYRKAFISEIYVHPRDKKKIYLTSHVTGLHVSTDAGKTFTQVVAPDDHNDDGETKRLPSTTVPMAAVAVHPAREGRHLAISDGGIVYRSVDRAETWTPVGMLGHVAGMLVPDTADHSWLATGRTLSRSADDGATWQTLFPPADGSLDVDAETLVVGVHRGAAAEGKSGTLRILTDRDGMLYTSEDDGKTWSAAKPHKGISSSSDTWAAAMSVDAGNENHIVVAARSTYETWDPKDANGGVFETWDGGATWADITEGLRLSKNAKPDERRTKAYWNRAACVEIDTSSGLILYCANRRGLLVRPYIDPKAGKKLTTAPVWVDVTPKEPRHPEMAAHVHTVTADQTDTRIVLQLTGDGGAAAGYEITGRALKSRYVHETAEKPEGEAPAWAAFASPGDGVRLSSLSADAQLPGRLIGTDRLGGHGILIYEIAGSRPEVPSKDDPKKGDAKKADPSKGGTEDAAAPAMQPPEGMRAFTAGQDKTLRIWAVDKVATGQAAKPSLMNGHGNAVRCIALSPDESHVLSGSEDRTLRIWKASNGQAVAEVKLEAAAQDLAIDDDSQFAYLALGDTKKVVQVDIATRKLTELLGHKGSVLCVATSEDVNRAYSGGDDNIIIVWDATKGTEVNSMVYGAPVIALAVAADGSRVFAAGRDSTIAAFDATGKPAGRLDNLPAAASALALSPDGATLYATTKDGVLAINTKDLSAGATYAAPNAGALTCVETSADGLWIFAGDAKGGFWMWGKGKTKAHAARAQGHEGALHGICVTPDETELAADVDAPKDAPKDAPEDAAKDAPEDAAKDAPKDGAKDAPKAGPEDAPKDDAKDAPKDAPEDAPKADPAKPDAPKQPDAPKK